MAETMKRWVMNNFGAQNLNLQDAAVPTPKFGEVLVRTAAISLNYRDKLMIGNGMGSALTFPFIPASDLAGDVVAVGEGASRFRIGDQVMTTFMPGYIDGLPQGAARDLPYRSLGGVYPGVLASYVCFPEDWFVLKPSTLDMAEASTVTVAGSTAWMALVERAKIGEGDWVLIHGTGGVALFGAQIAKILGARVIVVTSSSEKAERVRALGADLAINRNEGEWTDAVVAATAGRGVDHVVETVGDANVGRSVDVTAIGGRISLIGVLEGFGFTGPAGALMLKQIAIQGVNVAPRSGLERFNHFVDQHRLKPVIDKAYDFADLPAALYHLDRGAFGKIVVRV